MGYYENIVKARKEIKQWISDHGDKNVEETYNKLVLYIADTYGFSKKFIEKCFDERDVQIAKGVLCDKV